jgi:hypothetical protein
MSSGESASLLGRGSSFGSAGGAVRSSWGGEAVKTIGFFGSVVLISKRQRTRNNNAIVALLGL